MAKKLNTNKKNIKKGGYIGEEIWLAHRMEGVVKNKSTEHIKKPKVIKQKIMIKKSDNTNKIHKAKIEDIDKSIN